VLRLEVMRTLKEKANGVLHKPRDRVELRERVGGTGQQMACCALAVGNDRRPTPSELPR
jgi:hypothetical protein